MCVCVRLIAHAALLSKPQQGSRKHIPGVNDQNEGKILHIYHTLASREKEGVKRKRDRQKEGERKRSGL